MAIAMDDFQGSLDRLVEILRIPSISTDPASDADVLRAANWFSDAFTSIGMQSEVITTKGHPIVLAEHPAPAGAPTVLYYGHYDVQPADPLELWDSPPFDPQVVDDENGGRVVARGAVDDKGQVMCIVEAIRAWFATPDGPPVGIKVMLEGEEESGSPSLDPFLESHAERLAADICVVSDTGMWDAETPAITTMLRGMIYVDLEITGPSMDLHSGMYGGAVPNPLNVLARIIAGMHDEDGRVMIPGFYDGVEEPSAEVMADWKSLAFDESAFLASAGMESHGGECGRTMLERTWSRPTLDVNGIIGGYTGEGAKTIIPSKGRAKISCRLVPGQDPERLEAALGAFVAERLPQGWQMNIESHGRNPAVVVPNDSPWLDAARDGLAAAYEKPAVVIGCGGSIPAVGSIQSILGIDSLLVGFGLDDDRVHSPNEKFDLRCLKGGIASHVGMIAAFAGLGE